MHVELAPEYSTEKVLMVLRRFVSLRGCPAKLLSDNGSQQKAANEELHKVCVQRVGLGRAKCVWCDKGNAVRIYSSQCALAECHFRSTREVSEESDVSRYWESTLTFSELQTVCYEDTSLVNERPVGRHSTMPEDGSYLCPFLLLGQATPRVPTGPFR